MDGGAWWATVHGVAQSGTRLSDITHFTHNVVLVPRVWQSASVTHTYVHSLDSFPILAFTEYWVEFSVLYSRFLQVIYFVYGSVHKSIPISEFIPPLLFPGLAWWPTGKESSCQCRNCKFDLWVEKMPLRRKCGNTSIEASASASALPMNIQDWFPVGLTGWIPL